MNTSKLFPSSTVTPLSDHVLNGVYLSEDYQQVVYEMSHSGTSTDIDNKYIVTHQDPYAIISYLISLSLFLKINARNKIPRGEAQDIYVRLSPGEEVQGIMFKECNLYEPRTWTVVDCTSLACGHGRFMNVYQSRNHSAIPSCIKSLGQFPYEHLLSIVHSFDREGIRYYRTVGPHQECLVNQLAKRIDSGYTKRRDSIKKNQNIIERIGWYFIKHVVIPYMTHGGN